MKSFLTLLVIFGFVSIAVFGFVAMGHGDGHEHNGCIAAAFRGSDCPYQNRTDDTISFHLNALKAFSTAVFIKYVAALFLVSFFLFVSFFAGTSFAKTPVRERLDFTSFHRCLCESFLLPRDDKLIQRLAIHENSPTLS